MYNDTLCQLCMEDTSAKQNKVSVIEICVIWCFLCELSLLPPKLDFQGKMAGRIIPPDLSPLSVKILNRDGDRLERKKVASIRL